MRIKLPWLVMDMLLCVILLQGCKKIEIQPVSNQTTIYRTPTSSQQFYPPELSDMELQVLPFDLESNQKPLNITLNPDGTYRSYKIQVPIQTQSTTDVFKERLVIENLETGQTYQLQSPITWRSYSDIVWNSSTLVSFDQWTQPDYGIHYIYDVEDRKLLSVDTFSSEYNRRVVLSVKDSEGNPLKNLPVEVFQADTYTGIRNLTDSCGRTSFILKDGSYQFRVNQDNKSFLSSVNDQCKVLGCVRSTITIPIGTTRNLSADFSSFCAPNSKSKQNDFCDSHILFLGWTETTNEGQIWSYSINDGMSKLILNDLPQRMINIAFLNKEDFILVGNSIWLSSLEGKTPERINNPNKLLENFQPFGSTWISIAENVGIYEDKEIRFGRWHSPDGKSIAIWQSGDPWLTILNEGDGTTKNIFQTGKNDTIKGSWSPDGLWFAFSYSSYGKDWGSQMFIVNSSGSDLRELSKQVKYVTFGDPIWSPDGREIVYIMTGPCSDYYHIISHSILTNEIKSWGIDEVVTSYTRNEEIVWSPDNKWIAILTKEPLVDRKQNRIHVLNLETSDTIFLPQVSSIIPQMIDWR